MKYIKEYKDIDWDDWDEEEFDDDIRIGDIVTTVDEKIEYWYNSRNMFQKVNRSMILKIIDIKDSKDIHSDSHGKIDKILYDGKLALCDNIKDKSDIKRLLVWLKMENFIKMKY